MDYHIILGTAGWGVWHSPDSGKSWLRHRKPFPLNSRIQALAVLPGEPRGVLAAGDTGVFGSHDGGASWARIGTAGDVPTIWSLAVDPSDPRTLFAGTRPAGVYRSRDGGHSWKQLDLAVATECSIGKPFVTRVLVDPDDPRIVWAGVEIDGVFRSLDGGDTWTKVVNGLLDLDVHDMALARSVCHEEHSLPRGTADRDLALFHLGVIGIPERKRRRVEEHRCRLLEGDAMLLGVRRSLDWIPLVRHAERLAPA